MTGFSAASRSYLLEIAKLFLVGLHGFRSKIPHFATKAIFDMGSKKPKMTRNQKRPTGRPFFV